jgi:antitoxin HicB
MATARERLVYPAELTDAGDGWVAVRFPDLPEALTEGRGRADALRMAEDCLGCALAGRVEDGVAIPRASRVTRGRVGVAVPMGVAGVVAVWRGMGALGWSAGRLARRMGVPVGEVRRMLDARRAPPWGRVGEALRVMGLRLVVGVEAWGE